MIRGRTEHSETTKLKNKVVSLLKQNPESVYELMLEIYKKFTPADYHKMNYIVHKLEKEKLIKSSIVDATKGTKNIWKVVQWVEQFYAQFAKVTAKSMILCRIYILLAMVVMGKVG